MVKNTRRIIKEKEEKPVTESITNIIDGCYLKRSEISALKKIEVDLTSKIKNYFTENRISNYDSGKVVAKVSQVKSLSLDEEGLIAMLKQKVANKQLSKTTLNKLVQKREYIDSDNLEDAIYKDIIKANELVPFQNEKITEKLTFKKRIGD